MPECGGCVGIRKTLKRRWLEDCEVGARGWRVGWESRIGTRAGLKWERTKIIEADLRASSGRMNRERADAGRGPSKLRVNKPRPYNGLAVGGGGKVLLLL